MRLGVWLDLRAVVALSGSAEHLMPPDAPEAAQRHSRREIEAGRAVLAAHTAIRTEGWPMVPPENLKGGGDHEL